MKIIKFMMVACSIVTINCMANDRAPNGMLNEGIMDIIAKVMPQYAEDFWDKFCRNVDPLYVVNVFHGESISFIDKAASQGNATLVQCMLDFSDTMTLSLESFSILFSMVYANSHDQRRAMDVIFRRVLSTLNGDIQAVRTYQSPALGGVTLSQFVAQMPWNNGEQASKRKLLISWQII